MNENMHKTLQMHSTFLVSSEYNLYEMCNLNVSKASHSSEAPHFYIISS